MKLNRPMRKLRETFVDHFHRRHAAADDTLLAGNVVVPNLPGLENLFRVLLAFARDALEEGIDLFLG